MAEQTCAHPTCECAAPEGRHYCSDFCRNSEGQHRGRCGCGHDDCLCAHVTKQADPHPAS